MASLSPEKRLEIFETDSEHERFRIVYDTNKLMDLVKADPNIRAVPYPIRDLEYALNTPTWAHNDTDTPLTPSQVIRYPTIDSEHYKRIVDANLEYPLFVRQPRLARKQVVIINGVHRLAKAVYFLPNMKHIMVQFIPDATLDLCRVSATETKPMSTIAFEKRLNDDKTMSDLTFQQVFQKLFGEFDSMDFTING